MSGWLYKRDTTGGIRQWMAEADGPRYRMIAGIKDGKLVTSEWTLAEPKNVGRANETSAEIQAQKEVEQHYTKKLKEGYVKDLDKIDEVSLVKPMLAKRFLDYEEDVSFPVYVQPKLDGIRCVVTPHGLFSRRSEPFQTCPHIAEVLVPLSIAYGIQFDGELYNHELKDDFNQLQSLIMKRKPTSDDLRESRGKVKYYCYDILDTGNSFSKRHGLLEAILNSHYELKDVFVLVDTRKIENREDLDSCYADYLESGYEGQMVRIDENYEHKRSRYLLKRKEFEDAEFEIAYVEEGVGNRSGMVGRVTCKLPDGRTFGAGVKGGVEVNKSLLAQKDDLPGKMATIVYQNLTPDGIPRFPVFKGLREDL